MKTKFWTVDRNAELSTSYPQITQAAELLAKNEVVAFPTETVYGLGANAFSDKAVQKIYEAKGRPGDNPLIVHISDHSQLNELVTDIPPYAEELMKAFWPGPLTLILPKKEGLSRYVTAGLDTVAVRMPKHPLALAIIKSAGLPIAAPSANLSGKPSPTLASHVAEDLDGRIAGIVDGGPTGVGVESTVLDCTQEKPVILRPGGVTKEQLETVAGSVEVDQSLIEEGHAPKSPGMKYTHYAPASPLTVVYGSPAFLQILVEQKQLEGSRVGVLSAKETALSYKADQVITCGQREDLESVAASLYDALRKFDNKEVDIIYSEAFPQEGVGQAIMNRLLKAAGHSTVSESGNNGK
ncbi:threonylcarbamoyl-AMP synthase [Bacillus lacus]|uniref:Threonylcarbamoyl-AMP synthase n=1 Tax=Metabacillus lacus TaxID=1983721 RepID=A0A7X2IWT1_9BACI|nr:L-threonylcarbamoyladenylate synthase [Metabacillus lacus]MRX71080.1 threonylcarbamoyl-AMP synthase [Metabacillus lacus]